MTDRDAEVLRTIGRLKLVRTQVLVGVFFSSLRRAQRRLKELRDMGLVVNHRAGLPVYGGTNGPAVYRLTRRGLEMLLSRFPDEEHLSEGIERGKGISLRDHEHHDSLVELYLRAIAGPDGDVSAERAAQIRYWGDRDVRLMVKAGPHKGEIVPDAVFEPLSGATRVLVELDRSNKTQGRLEETVCRYAACFASAGSTEPFFERRSPRLLIVVRSERRAARLAQTIRRLELGGLDVSVLEFAEATEWLRVELFGESPQAELPMLAPLRDESALAMLRRLYTETVSAVEKAKTARYSLSIPALKETYAYLAELEGGHGG